jgi:hypothetical protein
VHIDHSEEIAQEGFIILDDSTSHHKIIKGLSGSPLLEKESNAIVGMVVGRFNEHFEEYDEAIAIPLSEVATIFEPLRMKIEQYQHFLKLEQMFIGDKFLATHRREALAEAFCERFLDDFCMTSKASNFQTILRKVKEKNLIALFIEWIPYWIDKEFKRELSIEQFYFENREKHLDEIVSEREGSTFITIDGALSCGKTHMLLKLKERFEEESWLCYLISCSKTPSTAEEIALSIRHAIPLSGNNSNEISGYALGTYMIEMKKRIEESFEKEIKGVVILFDDIDRIDNEFEYEKFLRLIREINSILLSNDICSKTVVTGNNLSEIIEEFDYAFDFVKKKKKIVLKPFKYPYVQKFIEKHFSKPMVNIETITARFFHLTHGHPGIMSYIVDNDVINVENLHKKLYWKNLNEQLINVKIRHIHEHIMNKVEYADIFCRLSYFRYFNDDILRQVYEKWFASTHKFKRPLRTISESKIIFNTDFNTRTINRAIRSIFLLHNREKESFIENLVEAQKIYETALEELLKTHPKELDVPLNVNKITLYLQEYLFLELNILYFNKNNNKNLVKINDILDRFEHKINYLINEIVKIKPEGYQEPIEKILAKLKQSFQKSEFKFHVCFFVNERFDLEPYRMLMQKIVSIEEEIAEEGEL